MWSKRFVSYAGAVWVISTLTGIVGGKSGKTGSIESPTWKDAALSVTPYIFIIGLAAALATALEIGLAGLNKVNETELLTQFLRGSQVAQKAGGWIVSARLAPDSGRNVVRAGYHQCQICSGWPQRGEYVFAHWQILSAALNCKLLMCALIVAIVCLFLARRVDLNEFSMHLFYRNRLVRCYLGASHKLRKPNPFTGFDPGDDLFIEQSKLQQQIFGPISDREYSTKSRQRPESRVAATQGRILRHHATAMRIRYMAGKD